MTEEEKYALEAGIEMLKELAPQIYEDGLHPAVKQVGEFCEDAMKTFRLIAFPIMLGRVGFHRFDSWCKRLSAEVDEKNMQEAQPNILLPTLAGLAINPDETLLGEMFFNILKSSIDKTKQKFLSPAFPKILEQLSKDGAVMLTLIKKYGEIKFEYFLYGEQNGRQYCEELLKINEAEKIKKFLDFDTFFMNKNHLLSLQLLQFTSYNQPKHCIMHDNELYEYSANGINGMKHFSGLIFSDFGKYFAKACISSKCEEYI